MTTIASDWDMLCYSGRLDGDTTRDSLFQIRVRRLSHSVLYVA